MKLKSISKIYGIVYFMESGSLCKIGITHIGGLDGRKSRIESSLKKARKIKKGMDVYAVRVLRPERFEKRLHEKYKNNQKPMPKIISGHTEFFRLGILTRSYIRFKMFCRSALDHATIVSISLIAIYFLLQTFNFFRNI